MSGPGEAGPAPAGTTVRVLLPPHLERLAGIEDEVAVEVEGPATIAGVLDALEARHPMLRGTIRRHGDGERRALMRFWAGGRDLSHEPMDAPLPEAVTSDLEPLYVVGAIAGG